MFGTRFRKILRDVWARKARTALVSIAIMIGVFGVVALIGSGDIIVRQLREDIDEDALPMIRLFITPQEQGGSTAALLSDDVLQTFRDPASSGEEFQDLPAATRVEAQAVHPMSWRLPDEDDFTDDFIFAYSVPFEEIQLEPMRLLSAGEGRYPVAGQNEVVIERRVAERYDLSVGDRVVFRILADATSRTDPETGEIVTTIPSEEWEIVGIVFHPYQYIAANGQQITQNRAFYTTLEDAQRLGGFSTYTTLYLRYEDYRIVEEESERIEGLVSAATPYTTVLAFLENPAESQIITTSEQFVSVIAVLAIVAAVVAGFLVTNVINTIVAEQRNQIGVMKSLGATRMDNALMYGGIAVTYGIIGMIPGVLLGIPAAYQIAKVLGTVANAYVESFTISPTGVLLGIAMGLLVPIGASIVPVYNGTRVTILEAMTDLGISAQYGYGPIARLIHKVPLPINVKQALANISLKKIRLALTVITLTLAVTAFMGVSALFISINDTIQDLFDAFQFEQQLIPSEPADFDATVALLEASHADTIEAIYPGVFFAVRMDDYVDETFGFDQVFLLGYDASDPIFQLEITEGRLFSDDPSANEVVVTQVLADALGKGVGDRVDVRLGGRSTDFTIVGIDGLLPFAQSYMNWERAATLGNLRTGSEDVDEILQAKDILAYESGLPNEDVFIIALSSTSWDQVSTMLPEGLPDGDASPVIVSENLGRALELNSTSFSITATTTQTFSVAGTIPSFFLAMAQSEESNLDVPPAMLEDDAMILMMRVEDVAALEGRELALGGEPAPNVFLIDFVGTDLTVSEVDDLTDDIKETLFANGITGNYENQVQTSEMVAEGVLSLGVLFNATSLVMALVGAIGLLTTLFMAVYERQKEIGVMRSVGATSFTIVTQFLVEGIIVGLIAWLLAAPLSFLLASFIASILPFGDVFTFTYPLWMLAVGLVGTLVIATVASVWPSLSAANRTVSDILRYQ